MAIGNMDAVVEATRARFRPDRIVTLFVGESAPDSGDFFYYGNNAMLSHMQRAVEDALGKSSGDFLQRFKAYGWYLDDLVLVPVDKLTDAQRKRKCLEAQQSLADRIAVYQPEAVVSVLMRIEPYVNGAVAIAGSKVPCYAVPFPWHGPASALPRSHGAHHPETSKVGRTSLTQLRFRAGRLLPRRPGAGVSRT